MAYDPGIYHPVWELYNEYRTARLNVKYYTALLARAVRKNFWVEWTLAATAPTSAIAVLSIWEYPAGKVIWGLLAIVAAALAVYKPLGKLTERVRQLEERVTTYRSIEFELRRLSVEVQERKAFDEPVRKQLREAIRKKEEFVLTYIDPTQDSALLRQSETQVNRELKAEQFYLPPR